LNILPNARSTGKFPTIELAGNIFFLNNSTVLNLPVLISFGYLPV
jgi:hypothetical protein